MISEPPKSGSTYKENDMSTTSGTDTVKIGEDESTLAAGSSREQAIDAIVAKRANEWSAAVESELQSLITRASVIRQSITSSKTQTKRKYFEKKFNKVSVEVRQMVAALQRIRSNADATTAIGQNESAPAITN